MVYERIYGSMGDFQYKGYNYIPLKPIVTENGRELPRRALRMTDIIVMDEKVIEVQVDDTTLLR